MLVEEQAIEFDRDVVMVAGMSGGKPNRVGLMPATQTAPRPPHQVLYAVRIKRGAIDREQQKKVVYLSVIRKSQRAVHVGFGCMELRIDEQLGVKLAIAQVNADVWSGQKTAENMHLAVGVADSQLALADEAPKQIGQ